jgi:hypothetical protein
VKYVSVQSSSLDAVAYDKPTCTLGARFKDGGEYEYDGVPEAVFAGILSARSAGSFFDQHVKKAGYRYRQVR